MKIMLHSISQLSQLCHYVKFVKPGVHGQRPFSWYLEIAFVHASVCVCVCLCVSESPPRGH